MGKILKKSLIKQAIRSPRLKDFKLALGLLLPLFLIICLIYPISAQFSTIKTYDTTIKAETNDYLKSDFNSDYGIIKLSKTFLWIPTDKIAEYSLTSNTKKCFKDCEAIGKVVLYEDMTLFNDIRFKLIGRNEEASFQYNFYILNNVSYTENKPVIKNICKQEIDNKTKELIEVCKDEIIGREDITRYKDEWIEYKGEILKAGLYKWKITGKKPKELSIDWIVNQKGLEFTEWANWSSALTDYTKRIAINITENSGITQFNYSVLLKVNYTPNIQNDFDDLRFTDSYDNTLYYYIESYNTTTAFVYVKVHQLNASSVTTIYMYYGNPIAIAGSEFTNAFLIADNFNSTSRFNSDFIKIEQGTCSMLVDETRSRLSINISTGDCMIARNRGYQQQNYTADINFSIKTDNAGYFFLSLNIPNSNHIYTSNNFYTIGNDDSYNLGDGGALNTTNGIIARDIFYRINYTSYAVGNTAYLSSILYFQNGTEFFKSASTTARKSGNITVGIYSTGDVFIDYIRIMPFASSPPTYIYGIEESNGENKAPVVEIISPYIYLNNFSYGNPILWCLGYDDYGILNLTMFVDNQIIQIKTNTTSNETIEITNSINYYSQGVHELKCMGSDGTYIVNSSIRLFTIDSYAPNLTFYKPSGVYVTRSIPVNITLNYTAQDLTLSKCYYNTSDNTTIQMFTCNTTTNISFLTAGNKLIYYYANDSLGQTSYNSTSFIINYISSSAKYNTTDIENQNTLIQYFVNTTYLINNSATLVYNGTSYNMSYLLDDTNITFYYNLTAPSVNANTNYSFYINYSINGIAYDSLIYYQTILNVTDMIISTTPCSPAGYKFSLYDEQNRTTLNGGTIDYNFKYGFSNNTMKEIYGTLTNVTDFYLCINDTINPYWSIGYGELEYFVDGYTTRRYYIFSGTRLTNTTIIIPLYDLLTTSTTEFLMTTQSTNLIPYVNYYISLLRWYPENNSYAVVDMGKTDDKGQTILKVETIDVDYRIGVYKNDGTLIELISPIRMICQTDPCVYSIYIDAFDLDLTLISNIQQNLSYDSTTKVFTYVWNDPSQQSQTMNLTVYKLGALSNTIICSTSSTSYTGVMLCNVSAYTGQLKAKVTRTSSPELTLSTLIVNIRSTIIDSGGGMFGLFVGAILVIFFALIGAFNPILSVIFGIIALIPLFLMGNITWEILMAIGVIGGVVIHFLRRTTL